MNERVVTLVLRTFDVSNLGTTNNEYVSNTINGTYFAWNNINIASILGDLALKYTTFNLVLVSAQQGSATTANNVIGSTNQDNCVNFRLSGSGINILNPSYSVSSNRIISNSALIGGFTFNNANNSIPQIVTYNNLQVISFELTNTNMNLEINYERVDTGARPTIANNASVPLPFAGANGLTFPSMCFIFKIYPVKDSYIDKEVSKFNKISKINI